MAKFRTNHSRQASGSSGMIVKVGLFGAIIGGLFFLFNQFMGGDSSIPVDTTDTPAGEEYTDEYFLPESTTGKIVHHKYFSLSYSEEHEQAEWTAHILTREDLQKPWNDRRDNFMPDPNIRTGTASLDDYRNSGYDRGHLVPSADMAFDREAMEQTFYLSNISPQARNFNKGIWRELEELTRGWAKKFEKLYVVTGPVLSLEPKGKIGEEQSVSIPAAYYKVLLDLSEPELKAIAFVLPNEVSFEPLYLYAKSVDEVEELTGIDFFPELMDAEMEEELESSYNLDLWEFSKQKFDIRNNKWNKQ